MRSDIRGTVDRDKKRLAHFNAEESKVSLFDQSNDSVAIDVRMDGLILEENSSFKILGLSFSTKLDWGSCIDSIAKTNSKKIEILISWLTFLSPEVAFYFCKGTIRPCMEHCLHVCAVSLRCFIVEKY